MYTAAGRRWWPQMQVQGEIAQLSCTTSLQLLLVTTCGDLHLLNLETCREELGGASLASLLSPSRPHSQGERPQSCTWTSWMMTAGCKSSLLPQFQFAGSEVVQSMHPSWRLQAVEVMHERFSPRASLSTIVLSLPVIFRRQSDASLHLHLCQAWKVWRFQDTAR